MKLSPKTIDILQNFAIINKSILLLKGNKQRTIAQDTGIYAEANIAEEIPIEAGIYELNKFLGLYSTFADAPDVEFTESAVRFSQGSQYKTSFRYCSPELIKYPPKDKTISVGESIVRTTLTKDMLKTFIKSESIFGFGFMAFVGDGENLVLRNVNTKEKDTTDGVFYNIGKTDKTFNFVLDMKNFLVAQDDYDVNLTEKFFLELKAKNSDMTYAIACEKKLSTKE